MVFCVRLRQIVVPSLNWALKKLRGCFSLPTWQTYHFCHKKQLAWTSTYSAEHNIWCWIQMGDLLKSFRVQQVFEQYLQQCNNFIVFLNRAHKTFFLQGVLTGNAWIMEHGRWRAITPIVNQFWRRRLVWHHRSSRALSFILFNHAICLTILDKCSSQFVIITLIVHRGNQSDIAGKSGVLIA